MDVFETRKHIKSIKTGYLARLYHTIKRYYFKCISWFGFQRLRHF